MPTEPSPTPKQPRRARDPFRTLAVASIILGMLLILGSAVFWAVTDRQSELLIGAGVTLTLGGSLKHILSGLVEQLPDYAPPPAELPSADKESL